MELRELAAWVNLDTMAPREVAETASRVEELGYSALWYPEGMLAYDSIARASILLSATSELIVATGITCIYNRPAWSTQSAQRVLYDQSEGRFLLGLGVSHKSVVEDVRQAAYGPPVSTMRDYLLSLDRATAEANAYLLASSDVADRASLKNPGMPKVISALGPKMLELARDFADGAHPYLVTPEHTSMAREVLGPDRWLCVEQKVVRDTDPDRARGTARDALALYLRLPNYLASWRRIGFSDDDFVGGGSDRLVDAMVAWGDDEAIVLRLQDHLDAGATQVCVQALRSGGDAAGPGPDWEVLERTADVLLGASTASPRSR